MLEGERVKGYVPEARWESLSILSSLRIDGSTEAIVYEGGLDGEFFKQWIKDALIKTLHKGDVVIQGWYKTLWLLLIILHNAIE